MLLLFLIFGAVVMKIASKRFLSLRGAGHLEVCLARDGVTGGEISGGCRGVEQSRSIDQ